MTPTEIKREYWRRVKAGGELPALEWLEGQVLVRPGEPTVDKFLRRDGDRTYVRGYGWIIDE
jgi:hypothetical protein